MKKNYAVVAYVSLHFVVLRMDWLHARFMFSQFHSTLIPIIRLVTYCTIVRVRIIVIVG